MARLRLLGGTVEEIPCIVIEADEGIEAKRARAEQLRSRARELHVAWLNGADDSTKWAFAEALREWAEYVDDREARNHAYRLLNGLI